MATKQSKHKVTELDQILGLATGKDTTATDAQKNALKQNLGVADLELSMSGKADANGMYHGLTSGIAENLMPRFGSEYATKEVIGLGGRKSGGTNKIDGDVFAKIDCIKGYTLMWRQMVADAGGMVTIGGTYKDIVSGTNYNRPYLMYNSDDTAKDIAGVSVPSKEWCVKRIGTETDVELGAGWKVIDILLTFGTEKGHTLDTTDKVAEAMGYVSTGSGVSAFQAWQAHIEQFASDMAYSSTTTIRNGRWNGLKSTGKDDDGKDFDFTRSIEQIRKSIFPNGMNGIGIGTDSEVCDTIEAGQVVNYQWKKKTFDGTEAWLKRSANSSTDSFGIDGGLGFPAQKAFSNKYVHISGYSSTTRGGVFNLDYYQIKYMNFYESKDKYTIEEWKAHLAELAANGDPLTILYAESTPIITPITELNLTYPVSNTEGTETPVCEPSTSCAPMAANITYGLDAYATIVDLKKRVEALEKK